MATKHCHAVLSGSCNYYVLLWCTGIVNVRSKNFKGGCVHVVKVDKITCDRGMHEPQGPKERGHNNYPVYTAKFKPDSGL